MSRNGVIGRDGGLPWHLPEDLRHFRRVTTGHAIIMGRLTHLSIGRALPKRRNIVITSHPEQVAPGCEAVPDLATARALATVSDDMPMVIGGARLYAEALPQATRLYYTRVEREVAGDTFLPPLALWPQVDGRDVDWREVDRREGDGATYFVFERSSG